jgi:hypothetical protein
MFGACTIVASNYLAHARVLARSFLRFHPDSPIWVLLVDDNDAVCVRRHEPFEVLVPTDVGIDDGNVRHFASIYDVLELSTAVKPWLLEHLVATTGMPIVYLDPDIEVFAPIEAAVALGAEHGLALTPHLLRPLPLDGLQPDDAHLLGSGVYNLGFLAASARAVEDGFFEYWRSRLWCHSIVDVTNQLFTDQRWLDWIDCFDHAVVRDPGCNVAYWNVWARQITRAGDEWSAGGVPLRFFHFSGFDPTTPWILSRHQGDRPRVRLSEHVELAALCREYAAKLRVEGYDDSIRQPYGWRRASALELTPAVRRLYRRELMDAHQRGHAPPPDPFDSDSSAFFAWLTAPVGEPPLPRFLLNVYNSRPDLQAAFPDLGGASLSRFLEWARFDGGVAAEIPAGLLGWLPRSEPIVRDGTGLNVTGYLTADSGVGSVGRLVAAAAEEVGIPVARHDQPIETSESFRRRSVGQSPRSDDGPWYDDVNMLCVNADMTPSVLEAMGSDRTESRATVALWHWEAQQMPPAMRVAWNLVDEVWVTSRFTHDALAPDATKPLRLFPLPVRVPSWSTSLDRSDLGLPEGFLVLFAFDWLSVAERKNPFGLIEAYSAAFSPEDGTHLVIKTINGHRRLTSLEQLRLATDRPDIHVTDGFMSSVELNACMDLCDCYASLHRAEGFGLSMAEAMAAGKPVVATAWSGNLDFMDDHVCRLVPAELVPVPETVPVYGGLGCWADPDLEAASQALRGLYLDPSEATALGKRAREHVRATRSLRRAGAFLSDQLERIRRDRGAIAGSAAA